MIAYENSSTSVTVLGDEAAVDEVAAKILELHPVMCSFDGYAFSKRITRASIQEKTGLLSEGELKPTCVLDHMVECGEIYLQNLVASD